MEEILYREEVFSVNPYLPRMMGVIGPFVLSQDITPSYDHDISVMRLVARREDLPWVTDIVQTLTRKVPVRLADEYFGFSAPYDEQMMAWARSCFREFFINLLDGPQVRAPAVAAGAEMRERLDALLAERRTSKALLRCLVDKVVLDRGEHDVALVRIVWRGGAVSDLEVKLKVNSVAKLTRGTEMREVPTLSPGDIVALDNLSSHQVKGVREAVEWPNTALAILLGRPV